MCKLTYLGHGTARITVQPEVDTVEFLVLMETAQKEAAMSIAKFVPVDWKIGPNGVKLITATVKVYA